jgi:tetratricopeptide (TPR) repeat protein
MWCAAMVMTASTAWNQDYGVPGDFLIELSPSAAAMGVGGGSVAATHTSDAIYLNPGLLGSLRYMEVAADYQWLFEGFNWYTAACAFPFGKFGTAGVEILGLSSPQAPRYNQFGIQDGSYAGSDNAVLFSYGILPHRLIGVGATLKMAYQKIDTYSGMGVGFDIGLCSNPFDWLSLGVNLVNVGGPTVHLYQVDESYMSALKSGLAVTLLDNKLTASADVDFEDILADKSQYSGASKPPLRWRLGLEGRPISWLGARTGINDRMFALGFDLSVSGIFVEYTFGYSTDRSALNEGSTHSVSLRWQIGKPVPQQEQELAVKTREVDSRADLQKAQQLYIQGYFLEAKKLMNAYVKLHPDDKEAAQLLAGIDGKLAKGEVGDLVEKAKSEFDKRNFTEAETLVTRALVLLPQHEAANMLKQKLLVRKENEKRIETVKSLFAQRKFEEMARELDVALSIDSLNQELLEYKSRIADYIKRRDADKHYAQASKYYYEQKKIEEANAELQAALDLVPEHQEARALHEKISKEVKELYLKRVGQMVDSKSLTVDNKDLKKLIQFDARDRLLQVRKLLENRQFAQASDEVNAVLRDAPADSQATKLRKEIDDSLQVDKSDRLYGEALKLYNDSKLTDAETRAAEAVNMNPRNEKAKGLLNDIRLKQRMANLAEAEKLMAGGKRADLEEAGKKVEAYLSVDSSSEKAKSLKRDIETDILVLDANEHIDKGEYEKADQVIQRALKLNPDSKKVKEAFKNLRDAMEALQ